MEERGGEARSMASDGATRSPRKNPRFFKVLLPGYLERLDIPRAFVKHITLKKGCNFIIWSSLEKKCSVKLEGDFPNLYFGQGWQHFAEVHSLEVGYLLVFCYEGEMNFSVIILDTSSCQKEYDHLNVNEDIPQGTFEMDNMWEGDVEVASKRKFCNLSQIEGTQQQKQVRSVVKRKTVCAKMKKHRRFRHHIKADKLHINKQDSKGVFKCSIATPIKDNKHNNETQHRNENDNHMVGTSESSRTSFSEESFASCRITMKTSNLKGHYYLYIPVKFKEAVGIMRNNEVLLRDQNGKAWSVEVAHSTKNRTLFSRGWKEFCIGHKLKPGDECEFHLSSHADKNVKVLEVKIFKQSEQQRQEAIKVRRTCGIDLLVPSFWVAMSCKNRTEVIAIPNAFSTAFNISEKQQVILRDQKNRDFHVSIMKSTRNRNFLGKGWSNFSSKNNLKEEDICTFSLIPDSGESCILHVHVSQQPT